MPNNDAQPLKLVRCASSEHPQLREWFKALASYEGRPDAVTISPDRLETLLETNAFEASFIQCGADIIGYTVTFPQTGTFTGETSLYLEDIFIDPQYRGRGFGTQVMKLLGRQAQAIGATSLSWSVLRTNRDAIQFYDKLGATPLLAWGHYAIALKDL